MKTFLGKIVWDNFLQLLLFITKIALKQIKALRPILSKYIKLDLVTKRFKRHHIGKFPCYASFGMKNGSFFCSGALNASRINLRY